MLHSVRRRALQIIVTSCCLTLLAGLLRADSGPLPAGPTTANVQPLTVELNGVPHELKLPLAAKENAVVTAVVRGGTPARVWIAREVKSDIAIDIPPAGEGRYQINLSDEDLLLALRRGGGSGQFRIFANDGRGPVASIPISFELGEPACANFFAVENGTENAGTWAHPGDTSAARVEVYPAVAGSVPVASAGDASWHMTAGRELSMHGQEFILQTTPAIRAAWERSGALHISTGDTIHAPSETIIHAIPNSLPGGEEGLAVWVGANQTVEIPGSNGYLSIVCGEIKPDTANLTLHRADTPRIDPQLAVGDLYAFQLGDNHYVWGPTRIEYLGKTQSRVRLGIWGGDAAERMMIESLPLRMTEDGSITMSFNGKGYEHDAAAMQLKELIAKSNAVTVKQVLTALDARQREKGSVCRVQTYNNQTWPLRVWIIDRLSESGWNLKPEDVNAHPPVN